MRLFLPVTIHANKELIKKFLRNKNVPISYYKGLSTMKSYLWYMARREAPDINES